MSSENRNLRCGNTLGYMVMPSVLSQVSRLMNSHGLVVAALRLCFHVRQWKRSVHKLHWLWSSLKVISRPCAQSRGEFLRSYKKMPVIVWNAMIATIAAEWHNINAQEMRQQIGKKDNLHCWMKIGGEIESLENGRGGKVKECGRINSLSETVR